MGSNTVRLAVSKAHDGWIGFGLGTQMVGSSVVIAFPTSGKEILLRTVSVNFRPSKSHLIYYSQQLSEWV